MGAWGTAIFSDDLAADIKSDFEDLIGDGLTALAATDRLIEQYASSINDQDEGPVFWLALASTQWSIGHTDERAKEAALRIIDNGSDLVRWKSENDRKKRKLTLEKLRTQLLSPPSKPKKIPKRIIHKNDWHVGEIIAFKLLSGQWTLLRVIGHHSDKGGRYPVCELLNWTGSILPSKLAIKMRLLFLGIKRGAPRGKFKPISQFMLSEPLLEEDQHRLRRLGLFGKPSQKCAGYTVMPWKFIDGQFKRIFSLE